MVYNGCVDQSMLKENVKNTKNFTTRDLETQVIINMIRVNSIHNK